MVIDEKTLLIDAICGSGFGTIQFAIEMEKMGYARFTGNQWNEDWEWDKDMLTTLSIEQLKALHIRAKNG